jgi:hypothetical protein
MVAHLIDETQRTVWNRPTPLDPPSEERTRPMQPRLHVITLAVENRE